MDESLRNNILFGLDNKNYTDDNIVYRIKENAANHKMWFVLDNNLVLPEYLVEFEYVRKNPNQNKIADFGEHIGKYK